MHIICKICGTVIAERYNGTVKVAGTPVPTYNIDAVILKCPCGRQRTYYIREDEPVNVENKEVKKLHKI